MYQILATKMAAPTTGEVTQAVSMAGANAVTIEVTVFSGTLDTGAVLQGSNDLENWVTLATLNTGTLSVGAHYLPDAAGTFQGAEKDIGTQYVRVKFAGNSSVVILGAGIYTSSL